MEKRMNKKGAMTTFQLLSLLLGVIVLVIVVIGFTQGWSFFTDMFAKADIDITFISQKCSALVSAGSTSGYCLDRIEIAKNSYVNCDYAVHNLGVTVEGTKPSCTGSEKQMCERLRLEIGEDKWLIDSEKVKVNAKTCASLI